MEDVQSATGEAPPTPEVNELKETGYYNRAPRDLMSSTERAGRIEAESAELPSVRFNARNPGFRARVSRIGRKVAPVKRVTIKIGTKVSKGIRSSLEDYEKSRAQRIAQVKKDRAEMAAIRAKEAEFALQQFKKGRQRGIGETAYAAGRSQGRIYASNPPRTREPLTFRRAAEAGKNTVGAISFGNLTGIDEGMFSGSAYLARSSGESLLGSLGSEAEFNYLWSAPPKRKTKADNHGGLWL